MEIKIVTSKGCVWCTKGKKLLSMANITDYTELDSESVNLNDYPTVSGYPFFLVKEDDKELVLNLIEFTKLLVQKGMVSSKK